MSEPRKFKVIDSMAARLIHVGSINIECVAGHEKASRQAEIEIIEDDTWQVLSADPAIREVREHSIRLMTSLIDQKSLCPGDILMKKKQWHAIIYDFDQDPVCTANWICTAMGQIFDLCDKYNVKTISLPLLGHTFGTFDVDVITAIMVQVAKSRSTSLKHIVLRLSEEDIDEAKRALRLLSTENYDVHNPVC